MKIPLGLTFDDVLLVPRMNTVNSRYSEEVSLKTPLFCMNGEATYLDLPIISANMDTVTEHEMANLMAKYGGLGIIHRFMTSEQQIEQLKKIKNGPIIGCIGVGENGLARYHAIKKYCAGILIDIAHGHSAQMLEQIRNIRQDQPEVPIIAGNVATFEGASDLIQAGANCIKCGVGPGCLCSTRMQTGNGIPQLTAILECKKAINHHGKAITLIADGGIKNSGDIVKALAAGADTVMIGGLLAGVDEAPGEIIREKGMLYKQFRGMASRDAQKSWKGASTSIEGESVRVPYKGSANNILEDIRCNILSGMTYQDARDISALRHTAQFIRQTSAGYRESTPHGA